MALRLATAVEADVLVYDVMDDLASFKDASPALRAHHREALGAADLVFAGGRSLHRSVAAVRPDARLFRSGVDPDHYASAVASRRPNAGRPVAGYVGVIDERLDLELIATLAAAIPDWEIQLVGPVAKIDQATLPQADNITYLGPKPYDALPQLMAGFDVALMPFALNEATRSISPTKTLEYLAAGCPVVSTPIADVVADFSDVVTVADDAPNFVAACVAARGEDAHERARRIAPTLQAHNWSTIAAEMEAAIDLAAGSFARRAFAAT
jgi:glycosyltransferase involved in cell wall biosynthesis